MLPSLRRIPKTLAPDILKKGESRHSPQFSIKYLKSKRLSGSRFGVVVSKKLGKTAVLRNKIRRKVYSALVKILNDMVEGFDVFIFPKNTLEKSPFLAVEKELRELLTIAGALKDHG